MQRFDDPLRDTLPELRALREIRLAWQGKAELCVTHAARKRRWDLQQTFSRTVPKTPWTGTT